VEHGLYVWRASEVKTMESYFQRLDERPEQDADRVALPQQLYESSGSEQPQEAETDEVVLIHKTYHHHHHHHIYVPKTTQKQSQPDQFHSE